MSFTEVEGVFTVAEEIGYSYIDLRKIDRLEKN